MNNGENNQNNLSISPVTEPSTVPNGQTQQPTIQPTTPQPAPVTPTIEQVPQTPVAPVTQQPVVEPVIEQPTIQPQQQEETKEEQSTYSLGSNVKIAPATSYYDETGKVNEQHKQQVNVVQPVPSTVPDNTPPQIQVSVKEETKVETTPENNNQEVKEEQKVIEEPPKKKRNILTPLLLLIILILAGTIYYFNQNYKLNLETINNQCTPVSAANKEKELDVNSTIVQDLYSKVLTDIREDYAHMEFDNDLKRYLAFRQIPNNKLYESNCNLFDEERIYNHTCDPTTFVPKAFKEETLQIEIKKLFGERTTLEHKSIQLGRQCIGGYEYIPERGEYVEGNCNGNIALSISVDKKLKKAISKDNVITLVEEVKYIGNERQTVPDYLQSGIYTYTFRIDTNYNYVLVNREFNTKY